MRTMTKHIVALGSYPVGGVVNTYDFVAHRARKIRASYADHLATLSYDEDRQILIDCPGCITSELAPISTKPVHFCDEHRYIWARHCPKGY